MPNRAAFPEQVREMLDSAYWRIVIRPAKYDTQRIAFSQLEETLHRAQVRLRGWHFPHLTSRRDETAHGTNFYATWNAFQNYEYWRFYESAQLIHYHGVREQVDEGYRERIAEQTRRNLDWLKPDWASVKGYLDIINVLYTVTEVFEFASRLAVSLDLAEPMHIEIGLENIENFILAVSDPGRAWHQFYQWKNANLSNTWQLKAKDLATGSASQSLDAVAWLFQRFGWFDANLHALRDAQDAFLKKPR